MKLPAIVGAFLLCSAVEATAHAQISSAYSNQYARMIERRAKRDSILESIRGRTFTPDHLVTAYLDDNARRMVAGARQRRVLQDSAIRNYDALVYQRNSVGAKVSEQGRERLVQRIESAARVRWSSGRGILVDGEGLRFGTGIFAGSGIEKDMERGANYDLRSGSVAIPYYPGREALWLGGMSFGFSYNEPVLLHPFEEKAEVYYKYATGDSAQITLPDGKKIMLREMRITPRVTHWTLVVGSFWFDEADYSLIRAHYRPSDQANAWEYVAWMEQGNNDLDAGEQLLLNVLFTPFRGTVTAITVEYGLFDARFWLPVQQTATGQVRVNLVRLPMEIVERFDYTSVNGPDSVPVVPISGSNMLIDSLWVLDSLAYHGDTTSARMAADRRAVLDAERRARTAAAAAARAARGPQPVRPLPTAPRDTAAERIAREQFLQEIYRPGCAARAGTGELLTRNRRLRLGVVARVPCSDSALAASPRLPSADSINSADRLSLGAVDDLAKLGMRLQAGWGLRFPQLRYGLGDSLFRYNRIEGLSPAVGLRQVIGHGYALDALGRIGIASGIFEGEVSLIRSNIRQNLQLTAYRRLNGISDYGDPFTLGASLQALLFGRDEGFYYRSRGLSFTAAAPGNPNLRLTLFSEEHLAARKRAQFSLARSINGAVFGENSEADAGRFFGASLEISNTTGVDPEKFRVFTRLRAENAFGDFSFGRLLVDVTMSRTFFGAASAALTLGAGSSTGVLPTQRLFMLGGSHTVRGQRPGIAAGDAFWLGRMELGTANATFKPVVFADFGWAGSRDSWSAIGNPLSGAGIGASLLDGLIRFDLARGFNPEKRIRFAMYLDSRF